MVEVLPNLRLVTPPEMPPLLRGFMAFGGKLVPVIRLEKLLHGAMEDTTATGRLTDRLVVARLPGMEVAWLAGADMEPLSYRTRDVTPLPDDHVLNNCASHVLPQTPPIIVLDADKLLLEGERTRLEQLRQRASERACLLGAEILDGASA